MTSKFPDRKTLAIGGIEVNVFSDPKGDENPVSCPLAVIFLLHGRTESVADVEGIANYLVERTHNRRINNEGGKQLDLIVVTFNQRNHGSRTVSSLANQQWNPGKPAINNDKHAIDMYSIQTGTAQDISFLIDYLPSYLFPFEERTISRWMVAGISLGGHSTWIALKNDPRITLGVPIIGCPDYLTLISGRAEKAGLKFEPPYMPKSLLELIRRDDPVASLYKSSDPASNPFFGKKILVLSGAKDTLVPWSASKDFVEGLEVGEKGTKKVVVVPDAAHECTQEMVSTMSEFIWEEA